MFQHGVSLVCLFHFHISARIAYKLLFVHCSSIPVDVFLTLFNSKYNATNMLRVVSVSDHCNDDS